MAARLVQAGMLVGGAVGAAVTIRGCAKATGAAERCIYCGGAAVGAALTGGYAYFHSDSYHEFEAARRREREEEGAKRVAEVRRRSRRGARQQREIEEDHRKRALESARLDAARPTYADSGCAALRAG